MNDISEQAERTRFAVYRLFAATGLAAGRDEIAAATGLGRAAVDAAFDELAAARHLVLDGSGDIVMAHPFSAVNLGFSVMGRRTLWWGGCAWDSFAIPHLVPDEPSVLVATTCPGCGTALAWVVRRDAPPAGDEVAHFLVPAARVWDDVVHSCGHQRLFCGDACVARWLADTGNQRGSVFDLATLWRLASHWYDGRLDSPYRRREPTEAADYFRSAGLTGEFWGL